MRNIAAAIVLGAVCALAAGCGGGGKSSTASTAGGPTGAGQTLHIMGFGTGDVVASSRTKLATKAIAPAKVDNPSGGFNDQQFLTRIASGNPPDIVYLDRQKVGQYAAKGALQPVDVCGIDLSGFRKPAVDDVTYDGKPYGVPEFYSTRTVLIDRRVLKDAGLQKLDVADWPKLKAEAKKLAVVSGGKVRRIGFDPKIDAFLPLWAKANGADLVSADGKTAQLDDPKVVEALRYAVSLVNEQGGWNAFKAFRDTWDFFGGGNEFVKDQVGAFPMEDWYFSTLATSSGKKIDLGVQPFTDRQGNPISWETGNAWAIPKGAKHVKLACEWARTMTEKSTWLAAAKADIAFDRKSDAPFIGLFTANVAADDAIHALWKPSGTQFDRAAKLLWQMQDKAFSIPVSPASAEVQTAYTSAVTRALEGQQSPKAALEQAQKEAQRAIDSAEAG